MDSAVPMILPKGIVINSKNIYKEVADFPVVPPDKVWEYWHVYTTTYKKLKDPTACRLENFWWHVWGSDRRILKGSTLAKLYEDISVGPTFVPLKGPPNRWEGPDIPPIMMQLLEAVRAEQTPPKPVPKSRSSKKRSDPVLKTLSSSASKPPPPHPILKKARGPSSSGPRPTARFVSPHESADEDDIPSSGSTAATASEAPVYVVASPKKKTVTPARKFVASTATKRRPSLPKRQSSETTSRGSASSSGSRQAATQYSVPPIVEQDPEAIASVSEKSNSSESQDHQVMSEKALGKQPVVPRRPISGVNGVPKPDVATSSQPDQLPFAKPLKPGVPQAQPLVDAPHPTGRRDSATSRSSFGVGSLESGSGFSTTSMARSQSQGGYNPKRSLSFRAPAHASTSNIAAEGTILDQSGLGSLPQTSVIDPVITHHSIKIESLKPSILDSRLTPTQPTTSASVPLGRTRSQLTLLLEREKSRSGKTRSKN